MKGHKREKLENPSKWWHPNRLVLCFDLLPSVSNKWQTIKYCYDRENSFTMVVKSYLFMPVPLSLRSGKNAVFVEKCQVNGTGRLDDVTNSVFPWILGHHEWTTYQEQNKSNKRWEGQELLETQIKGMVKLIDITLKNLLHWNIETWPGTTGNTVILYY